MKTIETSHSGVTEKVQFSYTTSRGHRHGFIHSFALGVAELGGHVRTCPQHPLIWPSLETPLVSKQTDVTKFKNRKSTCFQINQTNGCLDTFLCSRLPVAPSRRAVRHARSACHRGGTQGRRVSLLIISLCILKRGAAPSGNPELTTGAHFSDLDSLKPPRWALTKEENQRGTNQEDKHLSLFPSGCPSEFFSPLHPPPSPPLSSLSET